MKTVDTHELSQPWAQRAWRVDYGIFSGFRTAKARRNARIRMRNVRREAALERRISALERENAMLHDLITLARNQIAQWDTIKSEESYEGFMAQQAWKEES